MSSEEFLSSYKKINSLDSQIFDKIDLSVKLEEAEKPLDAIQSYKNAIEQIDQTLGLQISVPDDKDSVKLEWDEACKIIHKLKRTRAELLQRIGILTQQHKQLVDDEKSISLDETDCEPPISKSRLSSDKFAYEVESGRPRTYTELATELKNLKNSKSNGAKKLDLIFTCDRVKFYKIKPNGTVTTSDESCTMRILRLDKDEIKNLNTTFFIQIIKSEISIEIIEISDDDDDHTNSMEISPIVDEVPRDNFDAEDNSSWIYPLIPCVSPCFRTEYGAFIFPDLEADEYGTSFGIILPPDEHADEIVLEILEEILHGVVMQLKEDHRPRIPRDTSTQISENLVKGAQFISKNLIKGAEKTGQFLNYSTPYIISKLQRATDDAPPVSSNVQTSVEVAKSVTGVAAGVTGYIAGKVGSATMSLGRFLAPHIQKQGSTLLSKTLGVEEKEAEDKMQGVLTVAAGAVEGFGTIYSSLEDSAKILGNNLSNNSVKIIEHKYGPSAGSLATHTFDTIGNVLNVSQNVNYMTPKGIVKKTAKNTGKAIVEDFRPSTSSSLANGQRTISASSLYPELKGIEH